MLLVQAALLLLVLCQNLQQSHAVVFKLTNAVCKTLNETWIDFPVCRLRAVNRHKVCLNIDAMLHHPVHDAFIKGDLMKKANGYKPWLYSANFDGCQFIRRRNNPIIRLIWEFFKEFSNINHTCPYVGLQRVKDFYLKYEKLPTPIPSGEYLVHLTWLFNKRPQAVTDIYFTFVEDF
ncbi:uncharacterized protein LOC108601273 [Drosophila busckii]|uniref:uncharacterized protein LOC108601273 n=1 Tax=Drosophila busckii TaxID=30019 RepID=UPI00083EE349|nr:uncharacterized protein LOC108601273 [Drosophila busckii]